MPMIANVLTAVVLLIHAYIVLLETALFRRLGPKVFRFPPEQYEMRAPAMLNQGCYNGFLVAALALGLCLPDPAQAAVLREFGLGCVCVAGVFGAATVSSRIFFIQTVPAALALAAWLAA